jgi:hypothetical protein
MDLTQMVGQVGFPIAVAMWLLVRLDQKLASFERAAAALAARLEEHTNRCLECREYRRNGNQNEERRGCR